MKATVIGVCILIFVFVALGCSSDDLPGQDELGDSEGTPGGLELRIDGYSLDDVSSCSQGPCVSLGRIDRQAGEGDVPLVVLNARSIARFTFDWTYDDSIFYVNDVRAGDVEPSAFSQFRCGEPALDPGNVRLDCSISGSCSVGGTGVLATLRIVPRKEGATSLLDDGTSANVTLYGCDSQGNVVKYSLGPAIRNAEIFVYDSQ